MMEIRINAQWDRNPFCGMYVSLWNATRFYLLIDAVSSSLKSTSFMRHFLPIELTWTSIFSLSSSYEIYISGKTKHPNSKQD